MREDINIMFENKMSHLDLRRKVISQREFAKAKAV